MGEQLCWVLYKMNLPFFFFQNDMNVKVTATCIRVPVMRAHAESLNLQFENPLDEVIM
jgi:aspartate-semialdehyde dehydrogenase